MFAFSGCSYRFSLQPISRLGSPKISLLIPINPRQSHPHSHLSMVYGPCIYIYIYIYVCMYVCMCMCMCMYMYMYIYMEYPHLYIGLYELYGITWDYMGYTWIYKPRILSGGARPSCIPSHNATALPLPAHCPNSSSPRAKTRPAYGEVVSCPPGKDEKVAIFEAKSGRMMRKWRLTILMFLNHGARLKNQGLHQKNQWFPVKVRKCPIAPRSRWDNASNPQQPAQLCC